MQSVILLREKGGTQLWQPISPTLMRALVRHSEQRATGTGPGEPLPRTRKGVPLTRRRYNHLFDRHSHTGTGPTGIYTTATIPEVATAVAHPGNHLPWLPRPHCPNRGRPYA